MHAELQRILKELKKIIIDTIGVLKKNG